MTSKKILILEDDESISEGIKAILESEGFEVLVAFNGIQGLEHIKTHKPKLMFLDLYMPVMNGFDFLKEFKIRHPYLRSQSHVILISAADNNLQEILSEVDGCLQKPIHLHELVATARKFENLL